MRCLFADRCDQFALRIRAMGAVSAFVVNLDVCAGCRDERCFVKCRKAAERERTSCFMFGPSLRRTDLIRHITRVKPSFGAGALLERCLLVAQILAAYRERAARLFGMKAICVALAHAILQDICLFGDTNQSSPNKLRNIFDKLQRTRWAHAHAGTAARAEVVVDRKQPIIVARDRFVRTNLEASRAACMAMTHAHAGCLIDLDRLLPQFRKRFCSIEERGHVHFQVVQVSLLLACQAKLCDMLLVIVKQMHRAPHSSEVKHFILKIE